MRITLDQKFDDWMPGELIAWYDDCIWNLNTVLVITTYIITKIGGNHPGYVFWNDSNGKENMTCEENMVRIKVEQ